MLPEQEWAKTHSCLLSQVITNKSVLCHAAEWKVSLTRPAAGVGIRQAGFHFDSYTHDVPLHASKIGGKEKHV